MQPEWAESLIHQAIDDGLSIQFKQWGGTPRNKREGSEALILGRLWREFPKLDADDEAETETALYVLDESEHQRGRVWKDG